MTYLEEARRAVEARSDIMVQTFFASTMTMTGPEMALYLLTLNFAWMHGAALPADAEALRRALRYEKDDWSKLWPVVAPKWKKEGAKLTNVKLSILYRKAVERALGVRTRGRFGGLKRAENAALASRASSQATSRAQGDPDPDPDTREGLSPTGEVLPTSEETGGAKRAARSRGGFRPPTTEEIKAYCDEKGYRVDPEAFIAHYQRQGWKLANGNAMKDWRATVVTWVKREPSLRAPAAKASNEEAARLLAESKERIKSGTLRV